MLAPVSTNSTNSTSTVTAPTKISSYKVELEQGQPTAHCFCESPEWDYLEEVKPPQAWFRSSVDAIVRMHEGSHAITREDLVLGE
jgi:hypothetical protein